MLAAGAEFPGSLGCMVVASGTVVLARIVLAPKERIA